MTGSAARSADAHTADWRFVYVAWVVALTATLGAVFIGEVLGKSPCDLCWWQRIFMFPLSLVLGVGVLAADRKVAVYGLALALPGLAVAGYHALLFGGVVREPIRPCTQGVSCSGPDMTVFALPLPYLATAAFAAVVASLIFSLKVSKS